MLLLYYILCSFPSFISKRNRYFISHRLTYPHGCCTVMTDCVLFFFPSHLSLCRAICFPKRSKRRNCIGRRRIIQREEMLSFVFPGRRRGNQSNKRERNRERGKSETHRERRSEKSIHSLFLFSSSPVREFILDPSEYYVSLSISRFLSLGMETDVTWTES